MVAMMAFGAMVTHRYVIEPGNTMPSIYILWSTAILGLIATHSVKSIAKFVLHRRVPK